MPKVRDGRGTSGWAWGRIRDLVFTRDGWRCTVCGLTVTRATARCDHAKPIDEGGTDERANLRTVCYKCHDSLTRAQRFRKQGMPRIGRDGLPTGE